jgi:hypothetical protein
MGARRAWRLAPDQRSGVTIMDRFLGEAKMDAPLSCPPGGKAALASSRAKAGVLVACVLLGAYFYAAQERKNAASASAAQALPRDMQETLAQFSAARTEDAAAVQVRKMFYYEQEGVYCGEVNGRNSRGGDLRFKDGVRIFVCGPGLRERSSR